MNSILKFYKDELESLSARINDLEKLISEERNVSENYVKMVELYKLYNSGKYGKFVDEDGFTLYFFKTADGLIKVDSDNLNLIAEKIENSENDHFVSSERKHLELISLQSKFDYVIKRLESLPCIDRIIN